MCSSVTSYHGGLEHQIMTSNSELLTHENENPERLPRSDIRNAILFAKISYRSHTSKYCWVNSRSFYFLHSRYMTHKIVSPFESCPWTFGSEESKVFNSNGIRIRTILRNNKGMFGFASWRSTVKGTWVSIVPSSLYYLKSPSKLWSFSTFNNQSAKP